MDFRPKLFKTDKLDGNNNNREARYFLYEYEIYDTFVHKHCVLLIKSTDILEPFYLDAYLELTYEKKKTTTTSFRDKLESNCPCDKTTRAGVRKVSH